MVVNIHEAKTHLSRLLERTRMGEEVTIAKAGKPVAKLVAIQGQGKKPVFGSAAGQIVFHEGWDAPWTEQELAEFLHEGAAGHKHLSVVHRRRKKPAIPARRQRDRR